MEFGIIAMLFFTLFFGIIEFGRFFYLYNTVQEVTRCAAREAVVNWSDQWDTITRDCVFRKGTTAPEVELVAGWEISNQNVSIRFLDKDFDEPSNNDMPKTPDQNIEMCQSDPPLAGCIRYVEASVRCTSGQNCDMATNRIIYKPMFGLIPLRVNIPNSTLTMPAESLGYGMTP